MSEGPRLAAGSGPDRRQTGVAIQARSGDAMTACHHHQAAGGHVPGQDMPANGVCHLLKPVTGQEPVTQETVASQGKSSLSPVSLVKSLPLYIRAIGVCGCHLSLVTVVTGTPLALFESRKDGACDADQTGGDGDSDACNRRPFTFRHQQIGFPYRIDETQPSDGSDGERDPDYLKGRGGFHAL